MRNDMLFIDGKLVDLDDNTKITLNFKSNIFTDLSKIVSNNSYTIKLPKTIRNQRIISHAELPSADSGYPRKYHDARYFRNGVEVIPTAKAVLISISDKIEIAMTWGNITALSSMLESGKSLRDMDAGEYVGGIYYPKYIEWKDWGENDRVYPKVDYGFRNGDSMVWYHPVQSVKQIMEYIEEDNGISFIFPKDKEALLENMFVPLLEKNPSEEYAEIEAITIDLKGVAEDRAGKTNIYFNDMGNVGSFYGNLAVIGNGVSGGYYNGYRSKVINAVPKISGNFKVKVNTNVAPLSATLEVYNYNFNEVGSELDTSTVLTIPLLNVNFISDGVYEVLFQFENRQTEMLSTLHSSIPHLKFALQNIGKPSDVVSFSGTLKITNIEQEILLGGRYWIIPNLPDIKQSDFIKAISAIIGTFPLFTESNGLVFVSFDTIMSNKAKALDWTRRLVATYKDNKPNAIAYSLDDFSQKNFYRWKEDDTVVGKYDGYLFVENETIESERDVVELPFAASDQFSDVAKIPIYSYDEEGNLEYNSVEPRLLAYNGVKGVFTGLDWNTLLSMYYQTYQSIIRRPIVITEKIEINDIELRDLDMTVPIYLAQYGRYYAIISIKAEDTGICECKLLQLEV